MNRGDDFSKLASAQKAALVAYLLCQRKSDGKYLRQADLPELLGTSLENSVRSRLAKSAEDFGYLQREVKHTLNLPSELLRFAQNWFADNRELELKLIRRFPSLGQLFVAPTSSLERENSDRSLEVFGGEMAPLIGDILKTQVDSESSTIGVGGGATLVKLIEAISQRDFGYVKGDLTSLPGQRFFPLSGSLHQKLAINSPPQLGDGRQELRTASELASMLTARYFDTNCDTLSIDVVPTIWPRSYMGGDKENRRQGILESLSYFSGYREIFGLEGEDWSSALAFSMDACLVSIEPIDSSCGFAFCDCLGQALGDDWTKDFNVHCAGVISGVPLPKQQTDESLQFTEELGKHLICLQRKHLAKVVESTRRARKLGVCAVAHGAAALEAVVSALKSDLVSTLCVCQPLASALDDWLDNEK